MQNDKSFIPDFILGSDSSELYDLRSLNAPISFRSFHPVRRRSRVPNTFVFLATWRPTLNEL
jgi:hypothetical protein